MRKLLGLLGAQLLGILLVAAPAHAAGNTLISVRDLAGNITYQAGGDVPFPAESQIKLLLGYWVLKNGTEADKATVEPMIRTSNDGTASFLSGKYPQAIPETINAFGLRHTVAGARWGWATTTMNDLTQFLTAIRYDPLAAPLLSGMEHSAPIAADGYPQNYGTFTVPRVWGTKFGWSDARDKNVTASYGDSFTIAAAVHGSAGELTAGVNGVPLPEPVPVNNPAPAVVVPRPAADPWVIGAGSSSALSIPMVWTDEVRPQATCAGVGWMVPGAPTMPVVTANTIRGLAHLLRPQCG